MLEWLLKVDGIVLALGCAMLASAFLSYRRRAVRELAAMRRELTGEMARRERVVDRIGERNRLLELTESVAEIGHWRLDLTDDSLFWSEGTFAIHGMHGPATPPLAAAIEVYHEDDRENIAALVGEARTNGTPYVFHARLLRPDGSWRRVEARGHAERDATGRIVALYGMIADRTAEFELRERLREERDRATRLADAKAQFLAHMSHELRTPMNGVVGFTDLLLKHDLGDEARQQVELIAESGRAMTLILNDILDLSQIEAGELRLSEDRVALHHAARHVVRVLEPEARKRGLVLDLRIGDGVPEAILADGLRLRQVLLNLVGNAVKFTHSGFVTLRLKVADGRLVAAVRDSGIGIAADRIATIFDDFVQGDATGTRRYGGTGLGLAISRRLAQMMGGTLDVESEPGVGSTFTLTVPLVEAPAQLQRRMVRCDAPPAVVGDGVRGPRVLLAEDHDINQMLIAAMAKQLDIRLDIAPDGEAACASVAAAAAADDPYRLVLMDLQMPRLTGIDATRRLRAEGFDETSLPILALTANAFAQDVAECHAAGMQDHLAKPVTIDRLGTLVARWIENTPDPRTRAA